MNLPFNVSFGDDLENGGGPRDFSYKNLSKTTKNFVEEEQLGEGRFVSTNKGWIQRQMSQLIGSQEGLNKE